MSSGDALGSQFDLRPNIKSRPGSQGTLFHVDASARTDAARYPRGYTPDRQRDVMDALRVGKPDAVIAPPYSPEDNLDRHLNAHHERGVIDTVARSTIPAAHLRERPAGPYQYQEGKGRLGQILVSPHMTKAADADAYFSDQNNTGYEPGDTPHPYRSIVMSKPFGTHRDTTGTADRESRRASFRTDERTAHTLVHELGHHDSAADDDWEAHDDRREYDYNTDSLPKEEAYADDYATTHHRLDPRLRAGRPSKFSDYSDNAVGRLPDYHESRTTLEPLKRARLAHPPVAVRARPKPLTLF